MKAMIEWRNDTGSGLGKDGDAVFFVEIMMKEADGKRKGHSLPLESGDTIKIISIREK